MPVYKDEERGTWYFKTRYKDVFGVNKQKLQRGFEKRKDAIKAEADFLSTMEQTFTSNSTVHEVYHHNMEHKKLKYSTIRRRNWEYENHIKPAFGSMKIKDITPQHVLSFKLKLESSGLMPSTVFSIYSGLKIILLHAIRFFGLRIDPSMSIKVERKREKTLNFIKREEFDEKVEGISGKNFKEFFKVLFYTGLRVGECRALTWEDIDLEKSQLHVNKSIYSLSNEVGTPKTSGSVGYVPLPNHIRDELFKLKEEAKQHYYGFNESLFVFGGFKPYYYAEIFRAFKKMFSDIRIHDLRHSYATHLINNKVDIYLVKELMRHENIQMTANTYGHLYVERKHEAMSVFD